MLDRISRDRLTTVLLGVYRRLPVWWRRRIVRTISPSFTVGAMVFVERDDGAMLFVRHTYRERWGVPGGLLEKGEEPREAAVREVFEETGLRVVLVGEPAVVVDAEPQRVDVLFRARLAEPSADDEGGVPSSPEIRAVQWFAADRFPELQHETAHAMVALARSAHSPQARPLDSGGRRYAS
jgi:ADP-ribose pyrophosphatase YjhB (NUDIX family)